MKSKLGKKKKNFHKSSSEFDLKKNYCKLKEKHIHKVKLLEKQRDKTLRVFLKILT